MITFLDEYDNYIEELFQAQFEISGEIITHQLEKGQTREDFIKEELKKRFEHIHIKKGFVAGSLRQNSHQTDILILKNSAQVRTLGQNCIANVKDVNLVIEIKSNATGSDLQKFNEDITLIKTQNPTVDDFPLFGIFCYRLNLTKKTVFKRFGYIYDSENDLLSYNLEQNKIINKDFSSLEISYPEIDFILSIDNSNKDEIKYIYLQKKLDSNNNPYYVILKELPITKHLWNVVQGKIN